MNTNIQQVSPLHTNSIFSKCSEMKNDIHTCIYCLESQYIPKNSIKIHKHIDSNMIIKNFKCPCNYHYHPSCRKKSVENGFIKCPLCRKIQQYHSPPPKLMINPTIIHIHPHNLRHSVHSQNNFILHESCSSIILSNLHYLVCFTISVVIMLFIVFYKR